MKSETSPVLKLAGLVLFGFVAAVFFHHFCGDFLGLPWPRNSFLYMREDAGADFFNILRAVDRPNIYDSPVMVYFPSILFFAQPFNWLEPWLAFVVYASLFFGASFALLWWSLKDLPRPSRFLSALILSFLNYPALYCIDRGNFDAVSALFLFAFAWLWAVGKSRGAAVALGLAAAAKIYPGVLAIVFLRQKKYADAGIAVAVAVLLNVVAALMMPEGLIGSFQHMLANQQAFHEQFGMGLGTVRYGLTYFSFIKIAVQELLRADLLPMLFTVYSVACAVLTLICCGLALKKRFQDWEACLLALIPFLVFPEISFDYKMLMLLVPLPLALRANALHGASLWLFGLILIPKAYWFFSVGQGLEASIGIVLNPLLLAAFAKYLIFRPYFLKIKESKDRTR